MIAIGGTLGNMKRQKHPMELRGQFKDPIESWTKKEIAHVRNHILAEEGYSSGKEIGKPGSFRAVASKAADSNPESCSPIIVPRLRLRQPSRIKEQGLRSARHSPDRKALEIMSPPGQAKPGAEQRFIQRVIFIELIRR